jgi:hypothetical protein
MQGAGLLPSRPFCTSLLPTLVIFHGKDGISLYPAPRAGIEWEEGSLDRILGVLVPELLQLPTLWCCQPCRSASGHSRLILAGCSSPKCWGRQNFSPRGLLWPYRALPGSTCAREVTLLVAPFVALPPWEPGKTLEWG